MTRWTVADIPSQTGRRVLITGANSGIGYYTALALARKGAYILFASRDRTRGEKALARLHKEAPGSSADLIKLDLASLQSVRDVAGQLLADGQPLDLLINNAGVYAPPKRLGTADGFELQFGTNVLGHFALTALLMPAIEKAQGAPRIVTVASIAHKMGKINFDDLQSKSHYSPSRSYQQSKLANLILALEFDRRLRAVSSPVLSVAAHPGVANTNLFVAGDHTPFETAARKAVGHLIGAALNSDVQGALPTLYAATASEGVGGGYYGPQGFQEMRGGDVGPAKITHDARDEATATRLWQTCEQLSGVTFL